MSCTERVIIPVNGGVEDWKEQLKALLITIKQQPGYIRTRWGPWSEDKQKLDLTIVGWESKEASEAFAQTPAFTTAMNQFSSVLSGPIEHYCVNFRPRAPQKAIDSPVVEMITFPNCTADEDTLRDRVAKCNEVEGCRGCGSGYSIDSVGDKEGGGKTYVAAVGWESMEASRSADKKIYVPGPEAGVTGKMEVHHVNYNFPVKGFSVTN
ncbi:uncharacterized protein BCR38DRAFT_348649 [Pseudomassariella vexata]|uniref:ABM domain-containing protein n=1 Tax=Pseudomassariella vexata TaxID=1141098 RepID=A0A1Y2DNP5_9PEZI|nr:uncharacterized protein BCR38DRAFT_348649 [Pseudomassariella vexata]ORY60827.1 hypothetical protein BCR38DRAFT_348649 [Pseudomassariella vexata]